MRSLFFTAALPLVAALPEPRAGPVSLVAHLTSPTDNTYIEWENFKDMVLKAHAKARGELEGLDNLVWDDELAQQAQKHASSCSDQHILAPSSTPLEQCWGQNIAKNYLLDPKVPDNTNVKANFEGAFTSWWDMERFFYNFDWTNDPTLTTNMVPEIGRAHV